MEIYTYNGCKFAKLHVVEKKARMGWLVSIITHNFAEASRKERELHNKGYETRLYERPISISGDVASATETGEL